MEYRLSVWIMLALIFMLTFLLLWTISKNRRRLSDLQSLHQKRINELEIQIEKSKLAYQTKSDFLSRMSHEIRTPLNAVIGMSQIAQMSSEKSKLDDCMKKIEGSSKYLLGIINDILDFSKIESGKLTLEKKEFSLCQNIDFVISMFKNKAAEKELDLQTILSGIKHDCIIGDALRLNQVLVNLLSNAVKFTEAGGQIVLTVEEVAHLDGESTFRFAVRDNGVGIEPEQAKKLFTPFTQATAETSRLYGGTGLGLTISQSIIRMMGGEIDLETEHGKGSIFQFTIQTPTKPAITPQNHSESHRFSDKLRNKQIMIVDDLEINREIMIALLDGSGLEITIASNGKEALELFCDSSPYWYSLIFMDMQMPILDGCAATMEIRRCVRDDAQDIQIVAMTANVLPEDMERAYGAGMNGYLAKPIDIKALYAGLEEWI